MSSIPIQTIPNVSLVKELSSPKVYLVVGDTKFWITSPAEMDALGLQWSRVLRVTDGGLDNFIEKTLQTTPTVKPSDVFFDCGDNYSVWFTRYHKNCKHSSSIVHRDILVAGWLTKAVVANGSGSIMGVEDMYYDFVPDVVFLDRLYGLNGLSNSLVDASYPGNPSETSSTTYEKTTPIPFAINGIVTYNSWRLPHGGGDHPDHALHTELNAWHVSDKGGYYDWLWHYYKGRGSAPTGWINPLSSDTNSWFPFNVYNPDGCSTNLKKNDYVVMRGTLWQDSGSDGGHGTADSWSNTLKYGQQGWLEMHPPDCIVRVKPPSNQLRVTAEWFALNVPFVDTLSIKMGYWEKTISTSSGSIITPTTRYLPPESQVPLRRFGFWNEGFYPTYDPISETEIEHKFTDSGYIYSTSETERDTLVDPYSNNCTYDGITCYVYDPNKPQPEGTVPLHRVYQHKTSYPWSGIDVGYKSRNYFYTADQMEYDSIVGSPPREYVDDGIACYVYDPNKPQPEGTVPLHRFSYQNGDRFYTTDKNEGDVNLVSQGYVYEGIACYVFSNPLPDKRIEIRSVTLQEDPRFGTKSPQTPNPDLNISSDSVSISVRMPPVGEPTGVFKGCWLVEWREVGTKDQVFVNDGLSLNAIKSTDGGDSWNWITEKPTPFIGKMAHQSELASGMHQHYFINPHGRLGSEPPLDVSTGDVLFAMVYLDPVNPPSEIMLQWHSDDWEHRAYWGADMINWGHAGTRSSSRRPMGSMPFSDEWIRLEVPASLVGLEGKTIDGMAFTLFDGKATWDYAGVCKK